MQRLGLHGREQLLLDRGDADAPDQVVEEAVHDEPVSLPPGSRASAGNSCSSSNRAVADAWPTPLDLAGLDLQVGHGVRRAAVGEDQVAVLLVGLDALGDLADQHVADPDGVGALTLERTL